MLGLRLSVTLISALLFLASCGGIVGDGGSVLPKHSGLFPIKQNGKYGYIDSSGKVVINPQFDDGAEFFDGMARVVVGGKIGFIDTTGKVVIAPQFTDASRFSEGLAFVQVDQKVGVIDKTGKFAVNPQFDSYKQIEFATFSDGIAPVRIGEKVGYIDTSGKVLINAQFFSGNSFSEGLAHVTIGGRDDEGYVNDNAKCGYIDKTGKFSINPQFARCEDFHNGIAIVAEGTRSSYSNIAIDKSGKIVIKSLAAHVQGYFNNGLIVSCVQPYGLKQSCSYVDGTGNITSVQGIVDRGDPFSEGMAAVTTADGSFGGSGKKGYIDTKGKLVIPYQFYEAGPFWGGLARITEYDGGKIGYIDKTGKFIWNPSS